jgi:hypothetical protein
MIIKFNRKTIENYIIIDYLAWLCNRSTKQIRKRTNRELIKFHFLSYLYFKTKQITKAYE